MAMQAWILQVIRRVAGVGVLVLAVLDIGNIGSACAQDAATTTKLTRPQLEQLVAPIALYPDSLLSQIIMASTYPLEVVAAERWSQANPNVTGDALQTAMQQQPWDPSVKALTALPQTLQMMSDKLEWTQQLGDAFLAQQSDVLNVVQQLRARADANGQLKSTPEQKVTTTPRSAAQRSSTASAVEFAPANVYAIEPTNPDEYYVPIYDPGVVYGTWPYPTYPPYYWYPPGYVAGNVFRFTTGVLVGSAIWGNINWNNNFVQINPLRYNNFNRTNIANIGNGNWAHNPAHRGTVPYRDAGVAQRFGQQGQSAAREAAKQGAAGKLGQNGAAGSKAGAAKTAAGNKAGAAKTAAAKKGTGAAKTATAKKGTGAAKTATTKKGTGAAKTATTKKGAGTAKTATTKKGTGAAKMAATKKAGPPKQARSTQGANVSRSAGARSGSASAHRGGSGGANVSRSAGARAGSASAHRGGGGARGGGGRRGELDNGLGFYRFSYNDRSKADVGVMAQGG